MFKSFGTNAIGWQLKLRVHASMRIYAPKNRANNGESLFTRFNMRILSNET